MRTWLLATALLIPCSPLVAAEPPALTAQEIADGWLMLFDGETMFGWKADGAVEVKEGVLILGDGKKKGEVRSKTIFPKNFELVVETAADSGGMGSLLIHYTDPGNGMGRLAQGLGLFANRVITYHHHSDGKTISESHKGVDPSTGESQGTGKGTTEDKYPGPVSLELTGTEKVKVRSVKFRPTGLKPLFNGKNLTGWKVFDGDAGKRKLASKFEVTPAGEIHVVNGPGDLQTTTQYDDFCLQFECKTNGKQLNSGIFFRCLPDQYQNGYEAQIQNGYLGTRTNPIDFGTGAIYRRVKARKVVSDDNEWFAMTVLARGPHISTWVNGYQTVDWTDDRPPNDNPRNGLKTGKGHLSIQGHDPTTDILFRNLRIAELKK